MSLSRIRQSRFGLARGHAGNAVPTSRRDRKKALPDALAVLVRVGRGRIAV